VKIRAAALLVLMILGGPSTTGLLCGLSCMAHEHPQVASTAAEDDCHDQTPAGTDTVAPAVHDCGDHAADGIAASTASSAPCHSDRFALATTPATVPLPAVRPATAAVAAYPRSPGHPASAIPLRI